MDLPTGRSGPHATTEPVSVSAGQRAPLRSSHPHPPAGRSGPYATTERGARLRGSAHPFGRRIRTLRRRAAGHMRPPSGGRVCGAARTPSGAASAPSDGAQWATCDHRARRARPQAARTPSVVASAPPAGAQWATCDHRSRRARPRGRALGRRAAGHTRPPSRRACERACRGSAPLRSSHLHPPAGRSGPYATTERAERHPGAARTPSVAANGPSAGAQRAIRDHRARPPSAARGARARARERPRDHATLRPPGPRASQTDTRVR